jgi:predicted component of viral defense system (DUF524 family)
VERASQASLDFVDLNGHRAGKLLLVAEKGLQSIEILTSEESKELGEEAVQLREGLIYEYELTEAPPGARLQESEVVTRSSIPNTSSINDRGRIMPGSYTGILPLILEDLFGLHLASVAVEVQSFKLGYRDEYRQMMNFIADKCTAILMEMRSPSEGRFVSDPGKDVQTIQERFAFLKSILYSREFSAALQRIISMPHQHLETEQYDQDIRRGFRPNSNSLRQIAGGFPRVPLPPNHPLADRMKSHGAIQPSLPAKITTFRNRETADTPENRFVKYALAAYVDFLFQLQKALTGQTKAELRLRREAAQLQETLETSLSQSFFREISRPSILPLGSPVLQRKSGYREMLQAWLQFNLASKLIWRGGDDVYGIGKRDMGALYEYWLFFQLLDLFTKLFDVQKYTIDSLIEVNAGGFGLKLKSGRELSLKGRYSQGSRPLCVQFDYNRTFSEITTSSQSAGSWTRNMRPDFTFSFWPEAFSPDEAERQEMMVHVHFDAKYRAESLQDLFGSTSNDLQDEKEEQRQGRFRRGDLLKMHAYRDAIRRSEGAYVLYPGSHKQLWYGFHEILPSLGAFAVRPIEGGKAGGIDNVAVFIQQAVDHLCDRATNRERVNYHIYQTQYGPSPLKVHASIPEREFASIARATPPTEHWVLVGAYKDFATLRWIIKYEQYVLQIGSASNLVRLLPRFAQASHLLLCKGDGSSALHGLLRVKERGPRLLAEEELLAMGYKGSLKVGALYAVYDVERDDQFQGKHWQWDLIKLSATLESGSLSYPLAITLDKVLQALG